jgi:hypothetical protein
LCLFGETGIAQKLEHLVLRVEFLTKKGNLEYSKLQAIGGEDLEASTIHVNSRGIAVPSFPKASFMPKSANVSLESELRQIGEGEGDELMLSKLEIERLVAELEDKCQEISKLKQLKQL